MSVAHVRLHINVGFSRRNILLDTSHGMYAQSMAIWACAQPAMILAVGCDDAFTRADLVLSPTISQKGSEIKEAWTYVLAVVIGKRYAHKSKNPASSFNTLLSCFLLYNSAYSPEHPFTAPRSIRLLPVATWIQAMVCSSMRCIPDNLIMCMYHRGPTGGLSTCSSCQTLWDASSFFWLCRMNNLMMKKTINPMWKMESKMIWTMNKPRSWM